MCIINNNNSINFNIIISNNNIIDIINNSLINNNNSNKFNINIGNNNSNLFNNRNIILVLVLRSIHLI